jgi:hypothetical protein
MFKYLIDTLPIPFDPNTVQGAWTVVGAVIAGYRSFINRGEFSSVPLLVWIADGLARISASVFSELRSAMFTNVAQSAIRRVARSVFIHLLNVDAGFHLRNQTGGLTRAIDRTLRSNEHDGFDLQVSRPRAGFFYPSRVTIKRKFSDLNQTAVGDKKRNSIQLGFNLFISIVFVMRFILVIFGVRSQA